MLSPCAKKGRWTGFDYPTEGSVALADREITRWSAHRRARSGLARTFQHSRSFRDLTVRENVEVAALGVGAWGREARRRTDELLELLALEGRSELPAGALPHGDERRLGVARELATRQQFVLMDEPAAGLPEAEVPDFAAVVRSVRDDHDVAAVAKDAVLGECTPTVSPMIMRRERSPVGSGGQACSLGRHVAEGWTASLRTRIQRQAPSGCFCQTVK